MKEIKLTMGMIALVDDEWFDYLNQWKWQAVRYGSKERPKFYAKRSWKVNKRQTSVFMHQIIRCDVPEGMMTDHIDKNPFNNLWDNLRAATRSQNSANRTANKNGSSKYLGVNIKKTNNKNGTISTFYVAHIKNQKIRYRLGQYRAEIDAAKAYDKKAFELRGSFASLNFPEDYKQKIPN